MSGPDNIVGMEEEREMMPSRPDETTDQPAGEAIQPGYGPGSPAKRRFSFESLAVILLLGVLLLGAYFRFVGLNWDGGTHLHPDERFLTGVAASLQTVSDPLAYLRTSESPLNPYNTGHGFYVYGNFPMTATRYVAELVQQACDFLPAGCLRTYVGYDGIHLVGRALSGLIDLVSVAFIFLIGRRLYDWRAGLLAALLLALAVMPIQQSHFFTMDNWAAALTTVTLYFAVRAAEKATKKRWWLLLGLFLGLTVAARINVAPLAGLAVVAGLVWLLRRADSRAALDYLTSDRGLRDIYTVILGIGLAALVSIFTFRLAQPYAFADAAIAQQTALEAGENPAGLRTLLNSLVGFNPQWSSNMSEIQGQQSPEATFPPALQWTDRTPLLFPGINMVLYGLGITAGIMAWIGFFWALWQIARARPGWVAHLIPVTWVGFYFLFMGTRWVKSIRYFLPIYPFLLLLAGWALVEIWKRAGERRGYKLAAGALVALVVVPTFLWANAFVEIYRQPLTRVAASRWMYANVPTAVTLLYETVDGQPAEVQLPNNGFELRSAEPQRTVIQFDMPVAGRLVGARLNYVSDPAGDDDQETLEFVLRDFNGNVLSQVEQTANLGLAEETMLVDMAPAPLQAGDPLILEIGLAEGDGIIADTSRIVNEHWDDLLPANVDGKSAYGVYYREVDGGQRPITWPDNNDDKRQAMLDWIDQADYIALSSQRALWSTPRLPLTYPLNIAYYESLFNGDLGFELAAEFHGDIHIGPLYISDTGGEIAWSAPPEIGWPPPSALAAEEAFSVYDHPPVWIFRKTEDYRPETAQQILGAIDLDEVVVMNPGQATAAPNGLLLAPGEQAVQQANGTFSELFATNGLLARQPWLAAIIWWLAVILLGWLAFPLAFVVFRGFPGRGYAISRILSLLLVSYFGWIMASTGLLPNTRGTLLIGVGLLAFVSLLLYLRHRPEFHHFIRQNLAYIAFVELFGVGLFAFSLLVRLGNPDVWDVIWGGEKPMDLSYFNAVLKSTTFPPYDPWFAGGYINYYYYGFVYTGAITKLLGIPPAIAYNLILPMLFSFTGSGAFSLAYNLAAKRELRREHNRPEVALTTTATPSRRPLRTYPILAGVAAAVFCIFLGNLAEVGVLVDSWQRAGDTLVETGVAALDATIRTVDGALNVILSGQAAPIGTGDWFWTATRAINVNPGETAPITEFPYFTFLYGDLHAHMISLPLTLLALAWAVSLVLRTASFDMATRPGWLRPTSIRAPRRERCTALENSREFSQIDPFGRRD